MAESLFQALQWNKMNSHSFFFFCAPLWLRGLCCRSKNVAVLLWLTGFSQLALNGMKWCRKWARWKGLGGETVSAYHLPVALECSHGNRKWEASVQDGDQLVNGCIPQRQGVPGGGGASECVYSERRDYINSNCCCFKDFLSLGIP